MNEKIYYVYHYIDPRNGKVFYIGRGKNNRFKAHLNPSVLNSSMSKKNSLIKEILNEGLTPDIKIVFKDLTFSESNTIEKSEIVKFGKNNLTNMTTGGQGAVGVKSFLGKRHTIQTKEKMSAKAKGENNSMFGDKWFRSESGKRSFLEKCSGKNHQFYGKCHSNETKQKIRSALVGRVLTAEQKEQRKNSMKEVWRKRREEKLLNENLN